MKQTDVLLESYFSEGNKIGPSIMKNKYFIGNETMEEFIDRVSNGDENIKELIKAKAFLPGGRILAHIGDKSGRKTTLSNCYVLPAPKDDVDSIFETCANLGNTYKMGGGCGIDLSYLRPKGAVVNNAAKTSTGAVSFMNVFETATKVIGQNGRRGALMMMIDGDHPDAIDFINIKSLSDTAITSANVSVRVSDKFIKKAKEGRCYEAYFNYTSGGKEKKHHHVVAPHEILDQISERAWKSAEPGILFWDRIQNYNLMQNQLDFKIAGTNPCSELPLPEFGACLLGSINLGAYVHDGYFDYNKFSKDVQDCVVYLNDVLDEGIEKHPLKGQVESAKRWRAIGLGFMGLHDAMIKLGITYGDENSILFAEKIAATMLFNALRKSCDMAKEFGSFTGCNNEGIVQSDIFTNLVDYFEGSGVTLQDEITKLHNDIFNFGIRNAQLLTVAPTGTIGTMLNISTGIEPHFALEYKRKVESFGDDMFFNIKVDVAEEYMKKHNLKELSELPEWFITSSDINPIDRMAVQGAAQRFIDNAISSTINLPEETTIEQVRDIYWKAHDLGLKGVTIFRDNCFRSAILTKKDAEVESIESQEELSRGELKQVDKLNLTYIARVLVNGCGKLNLHMGFDEEGNLYDVFAIRSGSGGCSSNIQALVIALSHIIRLGGDLKDFARSIAGTQSCASYAVAKARGVEVSPGHSCGSAIAKLIIKTIKEVEQEVFESKVKKEKSRKLSEVEFGIKEKEKVQFDNSDLDQWTCPSCGARLQKQGGCVTCEECGYSKCD